LQDSEGGGEDEGDSTEGDTVLRDVYNISPTVIFLPASIGTQEYGVSAKEKYRRYSWHFCILPDPPATLEGNHQILNIFVAL